MQCLICDDEQMAFEWTDLHGEGTCYQCGTPYQILRYDEHRKRIEGAEPSINIQDEYIPWLRKYWEETHRRMGLGQFLGTPKYVADRMAFNAWLDERHPKVEKKATDAKK